MVVAIIFPRDGPYVAAPSKGLFCASTLLQSIRVAVALLLIVCMIFEAPPPPRKHGYCSHYCPTTPGTSAPPV